VGLQKEQGLFQLKVSTANGLGLGQFTASQLHDAALNTQLATTRLRNLIDMFDGDLRTALGSYKQGEFGVKKKGLTSASQLYADQILKCAEIAPTLFQ